MGIMKNKYMLDRAGKDYRPKEEGHRSITCPTLMFKVIVCIVKGIVKILLPKESNKEKVKNTTT